MDALKTYPPGALVRVGDICRNSRTGKPGLLPIVPRTWYGWVKQGIAPQGRKIGRHTTVWTVDEVLALAARDKESNGPEL